MLVDTLHKDGDKTNSGSSKACPYLQVARIVRGRTFVLVDLAVPPGESLVARTCVVLDGIEAAPADPTRVSGAVVVIEAQGISVFRQGLAFGVSARG